MWKLGCINADKPILKKTALKNKIESVRKKMQNSFADFKVQIDQKEKKLAKLKNPIFILKTRICQSKHKLSIKKLGAFSLAFGPDRFSWTFKGFL